MESLYDLCAGSGKALMRRQYLETLRHLQGAQVNQIFPSSTRSPLSSLGRDLRVPQNAGNNDMLVPASDRSWSVIGDCVENHLVQLNDFDPSSTRCSTVAAFVVRASEGADLVIFILFPFVPSTIGKTSYGGKPYSIS